MTWDFFNTAAGTASIVGLIVAAVLGVVSWRSTRRTDQLISQGTAETKAILERMDARHTAAHQETLAVLDRMDARAEDRHRFER